jgi:hypothetical protein
VIFIARLRTKVLDRRDTDHRKKESLYFTLGHRIKLKNKNMTTSKALLGVAAGIAAGAIIGILFAPDKGRETRKKIYRKGEDLADELNDKIEQKFEELTKGLSSKIFGVKNVKEPLRKVELSEQ